MTGLEQWTLVKLIVATIVKWLAWGGFALALVLALDGALSFWWPASLFFVAGGMSEVVSQTKQKLKQLYKERVSR